jgi:hypothetical protein
MPPVLSLGGTRRGQALLGLQQPVQDQQPAHQLVQGLAGDPRVRMVAALARSAWASVCSSRPIRFGFILAPRHPLPYAPPSSSGIRLSDARRALPVVPGPSAARLVRVGAFAALAGAPQGAQRVSVAPVARCAWFRRHTPRPRAFTRGRAERHCSGACPQQTRDPRPRPSPPLWEGRSTAHALDLERANAARDRPAEIPSVDGSSSGHNG